MSPTTTPRESRTSELLDLAARELDVDTEALWRRLEPDLSTTGPRQPALSRPWLAACAAAAVAAGALTVGVSLRGHPTAPPAVPGGGGVPTASATTGGPSTSAGTSATPSTSPAGTANTAAGPALPVLTPGMPLPVNQQLASRTGPGADYVVEGRAVGLGKVHVEGRLFNVLIVPATTAKSASADGKARPAACIVILPADASINARVTPGRTSSCVTYPRQTDPMPLGSWGHMDPMTNEVDEFRDIAWPVVATGGDVAAVDFVYEGTGTPLPYRLTLPGHDGAVFVGFAPYRPLRPGVEFGLRGRGNDGQVLFERIETM